MVPNGSLDTRAATASSACSSNLLEFGIDIRLATRRFACGHAAENRQHAVSFFITQPIGSVRIIADGFTEDDALGLLQTRRHTTQKFDCLFIYCKSHFYLTCHTTISTYLR